MNILGMDPETITQIVSAVVVGLLATGATMLYLWLPGYCHRRRMAKRLRKYIEADRQRRNRCCPDSIIAGNDLDPREGFQDLDRE